MKIDRRCFLSLVVGGAAGTVLSPLPWRLTDDSSIWSQTWPWVPVPPDGEYTHRKTTCTLCPGGCGVSVRKVDERCVKIEGIEGHPVNDGGICILGLSGLQLLYGARVPTPLKRVGKRGESRWRPVTWDEAVAEVAARLGELRDKGESHTVACLSGTSRGTMDYLLNRFMTAYGSPNHIRMESFADNGTAAFQFMLGSGTMAGFDLAGSDFIIGFGSGILDGWGSPVHMFLTHSGWTDSGAKYIQVEPRLSNTAAKADKWIAVNPGTEGALALGLCHVLIKESLYNERFVAGYTSGFEAWKAPVMEKYGPEQVEKITGVEMSTVVSLARALAAAKKPVALWGRGQARNAGSVTESAAVVALNALVGNLNQPGGVWGVPEPDYVNWPAIAMDDRAMAGMAKGRIDGAGGGPYPYAGSLAARMVGAINREQGYPVQALLVAEANPLYTLPGTRSTAAAFEKIPFVVSFSSYMDETAAQADLILPNHTYLERYEDVPAPAGLQTPVIGLVQPVTAPLYNTRHLGDVTLWLAQALGGTVAEALAWPDYETCLVQTLQQQWDTLTAEGYWADTGYRPPPWVRGFNTPSGRFEFANNQANPAAEYAPLPIEGQENPLVLIPYDSMRLAGGFIGNPPFMTKTVSDTVLMADDLLVEINPETAGKAGLSEGQRARLETPVGKADVRVHLFDGIKPGVVSMPRGLGHTAYDRYLAGKGVNANLLVGPTAEPPAGADITWGIGAKLA